MKNIDPPPEEKGEAQEQTESSSRQPQQRQAAPPTGVEGSLTVRKIKSGQSPVIRRRKRPVKMGEAADEVRFDLQKVYLVLRGVAETIPFTSDVRSGDLARFAAAVDFIGEFTNRIVSTPPTLSAFDRVHGQGAGERFGGTLAGFDPADQIPIEL
jgi:hypothetical protein